MIHIAFAGLRHEHIFGLYRAVKAHPGCRVIGAWEEDAAAAETAGRLMEEPFYQTYEELLGDRRVDVVAVGDYYGIRGKRIIAALETGHPVISDKPICTSLAELDRIEALSREKRLPVGCMLDLREDGALRKAAELIGKGEIGEVRAVHFTAQHPLKYGLRPSWYFEDGRHGGTFNDIAIHGLDAVAWMTGYGYDKTLFARQWNVYADKEPQFADSAHFSALLSNGAALTGDVSYAAPTGAAFVLPSYWRFTVWGADGMIETHLGAESVLLARTDDEKPRFLPALSKGETVLDAFLRELADGTLDNTAGVIKASRAALDLQQFADQSGMNL